MRVFNKQKEEQNICISYSFLDCSSFSKDLVNHVLGLQKPRKDSTTASARCNPLEQQMVLLVEVMQIAQDNIMSDILPDLFRNIATDLIFFVLFQESTCILIMRQNYHPHIVCVLPPRDQRPSRPVGGKEPHSREGQVDVGAATVHLGVHSEEPHGRLHPCVEVV